MNSTYKTQLHFASSSETRKVVVNKRLSNTNHVFIFDDKLLSVSFYLRHLTLLHKAIKDTELLNEKKCLNKQQICHL
jgi:hypothetical protein